MKKLTQQQNSITWKQEMVKTFRELTVLMLISISIFSLVQPGLAYASDQSFYAGNDILTYDKDAIACPVDSKTIGAAGISNITPEQKIAQLLIVGFAPTDTATMKAVVEKYKIGGIFPVGGDSNNPSQNDGLTKEFFESLNTAAGAKLFIAADDEGGVVSRFTKGTTPSAEEMGRMSAADVEAKGKEAGQILIGRGLNGDLAPVLDIATPGTPWTATHRDWSSNPDEIAEKAGAFAKGLKASGITPVYKHFPGIGKVTENTDAVRSTTQSIYNLENDLKPYKALVNQNGGAVMMSNGYVKEWDGGNLPVGLSKDAVNYLRQKMQFNGAIMTDALNALSMDGYGSAKKNLSDAIVESLNAGVDMPLFVASNADAEIAAAIEAVKSHVSQPRIDQAYEKSLKLRGLEAAPSTDSSSSKAGSQCCMTNAASGTANLTGADNMEKILAFLMGKGLTLAQATGVTGNFQVESFEGMIPNAQEIGKWPKGGFGIAQWTGGRRTGNPLNLVDWLTKANVIDLYVDGMPKLSEADNNRLLAAELDFFWAEEEDTEAASLAALKEITGNTAEDARQAARIFERVHERCSPTNGEGACDVPKRMDYAAAAFNKYSDAAPIAGAPSSATPPATAGASAGGGGAVVAIDPGHGGNVPYYIQMGISDRESGNTYEISDMLDTANYVKTALESAGYTVVMLRSSNDEAISKWDRVQKAKAANANIGISLHSDTVLNEVWSQQVGNYREYDPAKVVNAGAGEDLGSAGKATFENEATAKLSQQYADAVKAAREKVEGKPVDRDADSASQAGSFSNERRAAGDIRSVGNIPAIMLFASDIPWVYNEIARDTGSGDSSRMSDDQKKKYAEGIVNGVKATLPATGSGNGAGNCKNSGSTTGATGNKIADTALSLAWPNKGKHDGVDKSLARDTYQVAMPKYNLQTGYDEWTDCGVFTATVIRASGADPNYPGRGTSDAQLPYVQGNTTFRSFIPKDTSELKPGMVAVLRGHTYIYTGPYDGDDGKKYDIAQASLSGHPPEAGTVYLSDNRGPYTFGELK